MQKGSKHTPQTIRKFRAAWTEERREATAKRQREAMLRLYQDPVFRSKQLVNSTAASRKRWGKLPQTERAECKVPERMTEEETCQNK
jgi:hypothetical protein